MSPEPAPDSSGPGVLASWRFISALALLVACGPGSVTAPDDTGLDGLALRTLQPATLVPGSTLVVEGRSFVDAAFGQSSLRLSGTLDGAPVDVRLPLRFVDFDHMSVGWSGARAAGFPADDGTFDGEAAVEVQSTIDGRLYRSAPTPVRLTVAARLAPSIASLGVGSVAFVNEPIAIVGDGLLLGGDEGNTVAVVTGCFRPQGMPACAPVPETRLEVTPQGPFDRGRGRFAFAPRIAGIEPGEFQGRVSLQNPGGPSSGTTPLNLNLVEPAIFRVEPRAASLGQYVDFHGGGFIGPEAGLTSLTSLEAQGTFTPEGMASGVAVRLSLIPEFVSGPFVRYVLNEDDDLGR